MQPWAACAKRLRPDCSSAPVFEDASGHELKGIQDRWRLYRVVR